MIRAGAGRRGRLAGLRWRVSARGMGLSIVAIGLLATLGAGWGPGTTPAGPAVSVAPTPEAAPPEEVEEVVPPPYEGWTDRFVELRARHDWVRLADEVEAVGLAEHGLYVASHLRYLEARARAMSGDHEQARALLAPYQAPGHPFVDLALYHASVLEASAGRVAEASRLRRTLIFEHRRSPWFERAVEDELAALEAEPPSVRRTLAAELMPHTRGPLRRDLEALVVEALLAEGEVREAISRGRSLLDATLSDDAAERVASALDRSGEPLDVPTLVLVAEGYRFHRHFDRAIELLGEARERDPRRRDELTFSLGRAHFFSEKYDLALGAYLEGERLARDGISRARFLYHGARAAQLAGQAGECERLVQRVVEVGSRSSSVSAALLARLQIRLADGRWAEARADFDAIRRVAGGGRVTLSAAIASASALVGAGRHEEALEVLGTIPSAAGRLGPDELAFWRARAEEELDRPEAVDRYLAVLRTPRPGLLQAASRERLAKLVDVEALAARRRDDAWALLAAGARSRARALAFEAGLLAPSDPGTGSLLAAVDDGGSAEVLAGIAPLDLPGFPLGESGRDDLLFALGLYDDAAPSIREKFPLKPAASALTRALAFERAEAYRESIQAVESLVDGLEDDLPVALLPLEVQELLYPRRYPELVRAAAAEQGVPPELLWGVMREESRFDARARSSAAARGLMQFVLPTAREVAREAAFDLESSSILYRPEVSVELGARYLGALLRRFDGHLEVAVAAYNAGPNQAALWRELAAGEGPASYLAAVSFSETRAYVSKVLGSVLRYRQLYSDDATSSRFARTSPRTELAR